MQFESREKPEHSDSYRASTRATSDASDSQPIARWGRGGGVSGITATSASGPDSGGNQLLWMEMCFDDGDSSSAVSIYSRGFTDPHKQTALSSRKNVIFSFG